MSDWNEALEAYDNELEIIEGVRGEYIAFVSGVLKTLGDKLASACGEEWRGGIRGDHDIRAQWEARPQGDSPVALRAWAARPCGGPAARMFLGLALDDPGFKGAQQALRRRLFAAALSDSLPSLPGSTPLAAPPGFGDAPLLRVAELSMKDRPADELAKVAETFVPEARKLDEIFRRSQWLATALGALLARPTPAGVPDGITWDSDKLAKWQGGLYVEIEHPPGQYVWVCARPPGELILGHYNAAVHGDLAKELDAEPVLIEGENGQFLRLLDATASERLHAASDANAVQERASAAFTAYFRLLP